MRYFLIVLLAVVVAFPGCTYFENGLTTPGEREATFDPALLGEWEPFDPKPEKGTEGYFKVERYGPASRAFRITAITLPVDKKKVADVVKAYLVRLGEAHFLDVIVPPDPGDRDEGPMHFMVHIEIKKEELIVRGLDVNFIKAHPDLLSRVESSGPLGIKNIKVTATTRELGEFLSKHASKDEVGTKTKLRLRRR